MAIKPVVTLKTYFETGDRPTQAQFEHLIDSFFHKQEGYNLTAKSYTEAEGGNTLTLTFSDATTYTIVIPTGFTMTEIDGLIAALDGKVDKVVGKGLSTNDYDDPAVAEVAKVSPHIADTGVHTTTAEKVLFSNKAMTWINGEILPEAAGEILRHNGGRFYKFIGAFPFTTTDLAAEVTAGDWVGVSNSLPAPHLEELIPDTYLPSTTGNFILKGSYFTEGMTIIIEGHTYNYKTFINSGEVRVNLTTSVIEGDYAVTLNNGTEAIFLNVLQVVNGTVYQPDTLDWSFVSASTDVSVKGAMKIGVYDVQQSARWVHPFDFTKDFEITFKMEVSPLGVPINEGLSNFTLYKTSNNTRIAAARFGFDGGNIKTHLYDYNTLVSNAYYITDNPTNREIFFNNTYKFKYVEATQTMYYYVNNDVKRTFVNVAINSDMYLVVLSKSINHTDIKYIDLSDVSGTLDSRTKTSSLNNDGEDGVNSFLSAVSPEIIANTAKISLPAPDLEELIPDTYLPSTLGNFRLKGSYFTEGMTIVIEGHTYNYVQFINSGEILINLTTSATEGFYDVTLNNGTEATFLDVLQVVNGTVYEPITSDWTVVSGVLDIVDNDIKRISGNGQARNDNAIYLLNTANDWRIDFKIMKSPLVLDPYIYYTQDILGLKLIDAISGIEQYRYEVYHIVDGYRYWYQVEQQITTQLANPFALAPYDGEYGKLLSIRCVSGVLTFLKNNAVIATASYIHATDMKIVAMAGQANIVDIRYIDLVDTSGTLDNRTKTSSLNNDGEDGVNPFLNATSTEIVDMNAAVALNTAKVSFDLSTLDTYADDAAAAIGGVLVGGGYVNSATGAVHRRLA